MKWSFNRLRDISKIKTENIEWKGSFSWTGFEKDNEDQLPNIPGVYLFTFEYKDGFLLYCAGITKTIRRRIQQHSREFRKGNYTVFNVDSAQNGEREEIWHGWQYAKTHQDNFQKNKEYFREAIEKQLSAFRVFHAEIQDKRLRERIEASIMLNIYLSKEPWSELADRGMHLRERYNNEMPINLNNICKHKIYGLPQLLEV